MAKFTGHTITSDSVLGAAKIQRSLRFNRGDAPYLQATLGNGDENRWTWSGWVKKTINGQHQNLFSSGSDVVYTHINFDNSDRIRFQNWHSAQKGTKITTRKIRDLTSWMHIVVIWDSGNATADDRMRIYVNGTRETAFDDSTNPDQNQDSVINGNSLGGSTYGEGKHFIGKFADTSDNSGTYKAEVNFIDGTTLTPSSFGFTDPQTGIWMPKRFEKSSIPNKKGTTFSSTWTASGNGFGGSNPITNAFDGDLSTSANNDGGGQILTWNTSTYNLRGELRIYCRSSSGVYDIYVNGNSGNTTKVGDTPSSNGWVECGTFDHIKEIQFAGTTYNTGTGLGSAGVHILAITVDGTLLRNDMHEFGTNGFHLDFNDNSSTSALGKDTSGNGNDHATSNFSVSAGEGNDSLVDTPTNNFCTLNHLFMNGNEQQNHYNGNLNFQGDNNYGTSQATFPVTTGKWYWECEMSSQYVNIAGITRGTNCAENTYIGYDTNGNLFGFGYYYNDGTVKGTTDGLGTTSNNNLATSQTTAANGDILGIASDIANGYLIFYKNGTHIYTITGISSDFDWFPSFSSYGTSAIWFTNWGQRPFSYTPPAGHKSLCSKNLPPTSPSIVRPQRHFETLTWDGNSTQDRNITGLEFKPDFVWIKSYTHSTYGGGLSYHHLIWDVVRGVGSNTIGASSRKELTVNEAYTEGHGANYTDYYGHVSSFNKDGFQLDHVSGEPPFYVNQTGRSYVAWCWKAGGTAVSNSDGSITSSVSANQEAGFSIVTYSGNGSGTGQTVGHGLGKAPKVIFLKKRNAATNWYVYHGAVGNGAFEGLNTSSAYGSGNAPFNTTAPSSTVVTLGNTDGNQSGINFVLYCWAEIPGYSKFGSYEGNGNANGTYVELGFRPAWLMVKKSSGANSWVIYDVKRSPENVVDNYLIAEGSDAESTNSAVSVDLLSTGFKFKSGYDIVNAGTYVYMAFAQEPGTTPFDTFPNAR